jgi:HD superfamily phosphohydrolase
LRALKISRPLPEEYESASLIKQEGDMLTRLSHPNIIAVHEVNTLEFSNGQEVAYFIMDYVEDAMDLKKKMLFEIYQRKITFEEATATELTPTIPAKNALNKLYLYIHDLVMGLEFMHDNKVMHFDIKPENFLISVDGISRVADLGYAKEIIENSGSATHIGYTEKYAHPQLFTYHWEKTADENRVRSVVNRNKFTFVWDIYAFGQSIQDLLKLIDEIYIDEAIHLSSFRYLHLMACRMLDGENQPPKTNQIFNEMALQLSQATFKEIRYRTLSEVRVDLEKEMGIFLIDKSIPELNFLSRKTLHGAETRSTTFTSRLKMLVEHPLFSRLSHISQLGMIRYVYPTANHTRYDHSIGTYTNVCVYLISLYNDSENPLFKQLVTEEDIKAILLASLMHDLGHYPLAHDCEEIDPVIFGHDELSIKLLQNTNILDSENRTLRNIIEDNVFGWDVPLNRIIEIIQATPKKNRLTTSTFKSRLLSTIIDGPIDADKVDYLMRDSVECRLNYGKVIDFERLMKTITVSHQYDAHAKWDNVSLAIYDKGRACAESIAFARYLLFSAVYWHHTSRAYKAMMHHALRLMLQLYGRKKRSEKTLEKDFLDFVVSLNAEKRKNEQSLVSLLNDKNFKTLIHVSDLEMLDWIYQRSPEEARSLIVDLAERQLYKRLVSIHYTTQSTHGEQQLVWDKFQKVNFSKTEYIGYCKALQEKLLVEVRRKKSDEMVKNTISLEGVKYDRFEELMGSAHISILIDIPNSENYKGSITSLQFIRETMEKRYLDDVPDDYVVQVSEIWSKHNSELMKSLAVVRIFCHPEVRHAIKSTLSVSEITEIAQEVL